MHLCVTVHEVTSGTCHVDLDTVQSWPVSIKSQHFARSPLSSDQVRHSADERTRSQNQVQPLHVDDVVARPRDVVRDVIHVVARVDDTGLRDAVRGRTDDGHCRGSV